MREPSKVIAFRKPTEPVGHAIRKIDVEEFPRFRHEWNRPNMPLPPGPTRQQP
jgi:hypothetical protein